MDTLLEQTLSTDDNQRQIASKILKDQEKENYASFAKTSCQILTLETKKQDIRLAAGLALKNSILDKSQHVSLDWLVTDKQTKNYIKLNILSSLPTIDKSVATVTSQVIATIAKVELPLGEWHDLVPTLMDNIINNKISSISKQVTLCVIGYLCESLEPQALTQQDKNSILTAIIHGARREQQDVHVRLEAIKALTNSLEFINSNFENTTERDYIIKVVCDAATQHIHSNIDLQSSAYECLTCIMQLYYKRMHYISSCIFNLTVSGLTRTTEPSIVLRAIEFWSVVCEMEIQMKRSGESLLHSFVDESITYVLPNLLPLLVKDRNLEYNDNDEEEWNVPTLAAHCLSLFAQSSRELVVPETIKFIQNNLLVATEIESLVLWNQKEASIIAFGSILEGPCHFKTQPLVEQILPVILDNLNDYTCPLICIAASQTLYRIIQQSINVLHGNHVHSDIVSVINDGLHSDQEKVVHNSCLSIIYLSDKLKTNPPDTGLSFMHSDSLLVRLLEITLNSDQQKDARCRQTIYEAMASVIKHSSQDCDQIVRFATESILSKIEHLQSSKSQIQNLVKKDTFHLESSLWGVLLSCIYRLSSAEVTNNYADRIISLVSKVATSYFSKDSSNMDDTYMSLVVEDVYIVISAMITKMGQAFDRFTLPLVDCHLPNLLKEPNVVFEEKNRLCIIAVGIVSDLYCTFGKQMYPYTHQIMKLLIQNLKSKTCNPDVKPLTLSTLGDIAHALGSEFACHVPIIMMILQQAGNMQADKDDEDAVEYVDTIRVGVVEAFVGMMQGLDDHQDSQNKLLLSHVNNLLVFVHSVCKDGVARSDKLNRAILGLLGDVARIYGNQVQGSLVEGLLSGIMIEDLKRDITFSKRTREIAHWTQQTVRAVYKKSLETLILS